MHRVCPQIMLISLLNYVKLHTLIAKQLQMIVKSPGRRIKKIIQKTILNFPSFTIILTPISPHRKASYSLICQVCYSPSQNTPICPIFLPSRADGEGLAPPV